MPGVDLSDWRRDMQELAERSRKPQNKIVITDNGDSTATVTITNTRGDTVECAAKFDDSLLQKLLAVVDQFWMEGKEL